nr:hypothetical protein [Flavobacterium ustbae]
MVLHGYGVALVLPSLAGIAISGLSENLAGSASGLYATVQQLSGAFGIAVAGAAFYYIVKDVDNFRSYYNAFLSGMAINVICLTGFLYYLSYCPKSTLPLVKPAAWKSSRKKAYKELYDLNPHHLTRKFTAVK